jgi:hypothetical protein
MPLGALVNIKVLDFNPTTRTITVGVETGGEPLKLKLRPSTAKAVISYMTAGGLTRNATAPLFVMAVNSTKQLDVTRAMCSRDLRGVLTQRARKAKIATTSFFVRGR